MLAGLAHGGVPWPAIAGLAEAFPPGYAPQAAGAAAPAAGTKAPAAPAASPSRPVPAPKPAQPAAAPPESAGAPRPQGVHAATALIARAKGSPVRRTLRADPIGGSLALVILGAMVLSMGLALTRLPGGVPRAWERAVPVVVTAGMVVAAYLTYVEVTGAVAVCGPVGDCNAVQQSPYARLAGIPVAVLGLAGYAAILAAWIGARVGPPAARRDGGPGASAACVPGRRSRRVRPHVGVAPARG